MVDTGSFLISEKERRDEKSGVLESVPDLLSLSSDKEKRFGPRTSRLESGVGRRIWLGVRERVGPVVTRDVVIGHVLEGEEGLERRRPDLVEA